ncbi:hypothetical protein tinsulaeT_35070 [Thalassotalea insulae]|uniref:DUF2947 family protein n=1 Tax=Thalassotalea insulae TaxID=2056778 RepID=A0ABQ6GXU5_9GAMM|nr:DUF2947 family protein [Thalassotalea insulae]GLX80167.1 hypothetical protein tinsulaeT_35070 [Thalassotalea insulae]
MNYIPLDNFKYAWIFKHQSMPVATSALPQIKVMTEQRAMVLWDTFISKSADHPDFFKAGDWPFDKKTWSDNGKWQGIWENDEQALPQAISTHLQWDDNTVVYYCLSRKQVIETNWNIFKTYWKNFLFLDDGSLLIGKKRNEVVQFSANGQFKIGNKS